MLKTLQNRENKYFYELQKVLCNTSNCSEFVCFVNACDNILDSVKNDIELLRKITEKYFKKRILNEIVPEEWIQAILDSNSSRKKGKCGEIKLLSILQGLNFSEAKTWNDFFIKKKCVAQFSKIFSLKNTRDKLSVKIKTKKQNKDLDLIIKINNRIFIVEAKHLNTSGGGQDKQIAELIEIINLKEKNEDIFYIAFLDGNYSNILLDNKKCGEKLKTQRKEIKKYLKNNTRNFWLNTKGFENLFSDLN